MNSFLLDQGILLSIALAVVGLVFAIVLIRQILAASAGNEKMHQIAAAIQEGAKAYSEQADDGGGGDCRSDLGRRLVAARRGHGNRFRRRRRVLAAGRLHRHVHRCAGKRAHRAGCFGGVRTRL
jgi:hypothetical protein